MDVSTPRRVRVLVHALVTDQVLSDWDENGGVYETVVLGQRTFSKIVDLPQAGDAPATTVIINGNSYAVAAEPAWNARDGEWQLETTLPGNDNQPLHDCMNDQSWTESGTSSGFESDSGPHPSSYSGRT